MPNKIQIAISTEKEDAFFNEITELAYRTIAHPIFEDYEEYDPYYHGSVIAKLSQNLIREIQCNFLKYKAVGQGAGYLSLLKMNLNNLLSDFPAKNGQFFADVSEYRDGLLVQIEQLEKMEPDIRKEEKPEFTLAVIGLKHAIENDPITNDNKDQVANSYGYKSGHKLYQYYQDYLRTGDRINDPGSLVKLNNQIKRYKQALKIVDVSYHTKAVDELTTLSAFRARY